MMSRIAEVIGNLLSDHFDIFTPYHQFLFPTFFINPFDFNHIYFKFDLSTYFL